MPTLTVKRPSAYAPIHLNLMIFNPVTQVGFPATGLFDTGNDHTTINRAYAEQIGLTLTDREMTVNGVTGSSRGQTAWVMIGIPFDNGENRTIDNHEVVVNAGLTDQVLIGRDFLERFDVTLLRDGTFRLSF